MKYNSLSILNTVTVGVSDSGLGMRPHSHIANLLSQKFRIPCTQDLGGSYNNYL